MAVVTACGPHSLFSIFTLDGWAEFMWRAIEALPADDAVGQVPLMTLRIPLMTSPHYPNDLSSLP